MKVKYVIFGETHAVLLGNTQNHADVRSRKAHATSAGFCSFKWSQEKCGYEVDAWGESISLGLKSDALDASRIAFALNN